MSYFSHDLYKIFSNLHKGIRIEIEHQRKMEEIKNKETLNAEDYQLLEYERVETNVTDEDMLLIQINDALDRGDEELFLRLTGGIKHDKSRV